MALISTAFSRLFPKGRISNFFGYLKSLKEAVDLSLERVYIFFKSVMTEIFPGTATETIEDWFNLLNLYYDTKLTLEQKQYLANAIYTAQGSDLEKLNTQIQAMFPFTLIYIEEIDNFTYAIRGSVLNNIDYVRVLDFVDRIAPLHLEPYYDITIIEYLTAAYCGLCICGSGETGLTVEE